VLAGWMPSYGRFRLYYPSRKHVPAALRALIDFAREIAPASPERVQIKRRKSLRRSELPNF
jgi:DNA-binding transcriptional LysR family regulator